MYLRSTGRIKDGKAHRYWSVVESRRCAGGRVVQKPLLYLGEINESQHAAWCRVIEGFDEDSRRSRQLALFPAERALPEPSTAAWTSCSPTRRRCSRACAGAGRIWCSEASCH